MPKKLGVLVVHGMGNQAPDFADEMIAQINERIDGLGAASSQIAWKPGYWADLLQPHENKLWEDLSRNRDLHYAAIRRFVISNFGDAVAYQREPGTDPDIYQTIHERIGAHLAALRGDLGGTDAPLIVLAHSLGSNIMSNYIWDQQRQKDYAVPSRTTFEQMKTLTGFITFGSNIPLFSLAFKCYAGITFPPDELGGPLREAARWLNFYSPNDVLGYPIKPLTVDYRNNSQIEDRAINVGSILTSWNPFSHDEYWTDGDFTRPVAKIIADVLGQLP